jgi:hypothetical protein
MPRELRLLAALLFLDLLLGIWLQLHAPQWVAVFLAHLPVLGVAAAAWGLVPDGSKAWFRELIQRGLAHPVASWIAFGLAALLCASTAFCSSVHVAAGDSAVRTRIRLVSGTANLGDSAALRSAASRPLNRLTSPVSYTLRMSPFGKRLWLYDGRLASASHRVVPWVPFRLTYPDDFDTLATLVAVTAPAFLQLVHDTPPVLTIRDGNDPSIVLGAAPVTGVGGVAFGFPDITRPDSDDAVLRSKAQSYFVSGSATPTAEEASTRDRNVAGTIRLWVGVRKTLTRRPLVVRDLVRWELRQNDGALLKADTLRITHATSYLFLEP